MQWRGPVIIISTFAVLSLFAGEIRADAGRSFMFSQFDLARPGTEWTAVFADYPVGQESFFQLDWRQLTSPTNLSRGFMLTGNNHSDDLGMFIKRPICGLKPSSTYRVMAGVQFWSRAANGCVGIGGAPGENVYVKFGASRDEPVAGITNGMWRLNVDIGRQALNGANAVKLGDIATTITDCHNQVFELKTLATATPLEVQTDRHGVLWIFTGLDSAFEGRTIIIFKQVSLCLRRAGPIHPGHDANNAPRPHDHPHDHDDRQQGRGRNNH